jgi:hypothetical protein
MSMSMSTVESIFIMTGIALCFWGVKRFIWWLGDF